MLDSTEKKRILLVEDEPLISNLCIRVLSSEGLEVSVAVDGQAAEEMLDKNKYDLCLIDFRIPVVGGKELFQYIHEKYPELEDGVIFTSGDVIGGDTQNFIKETGRLFLPKPFSPEELRGIIREAYQLIGNTYKV
jgi:DNA-binding response OmpR family regulator